jgi:hypothetical protein
MRKTLLMLLALTLVLGVIAVAEDPAPEQKEAPWFDLKNCAFCKHLGAEKGLMEHMTWEYHEITDGCIAITTVDPEYQAVYKKACHAMQEVAEELESGKRKMAEMPMCGHCRGYGMLTQAGAKIDYVAGATADIVIMTSNNPETVQKIKEFAQRNRAELAAWSATGEEKEKVKTTTE